MLSQEIARKRQDDITRMVESGSKMTREGFAKYFDVSLYTIWSDIKVIERRRGQPLDVYRKPKSKGPSPQKIYAIKQDYLAGMTISALAAKHRYGIRRISDLSQDWNRPKGLQSAPALPQRHTATDKRLSVTADTKERAEAFLAALKASRGKYKSKTGNRPGMTASMEKKYAMALWESLGHVKGKAA